MVPGGSGSTIPQEGFGCNELGITREMKLRWGNKRSKMGREEKE